MTPNSGRPPRSPTPAGQPRTPYDSFRKLYMSGVTDHLELCVQLDLSFFEVREYLERIQGEAPGDH